jgi:hypothetical protein
MSQVIVRNNIGRDYNVAFNSGLGGETISNVCLQKGDNIIDSELWEKVKNNPNVKTLMDTDHTNCLVRTKMTQMKDDPTFATIITSYNDGSIRKQLEIRNINAPKK